MKRFRVILQRPPDDGGRCTVVVEADDIAVAIAMVMVRFPICAFIAADEINAP